MGQCPKFNSGAGMKMRRSGQRKKPIASRQVEVWAAGVASGPSYEAFTIPTPRGLSTFGTPVSNVDTSLTGRKRPASDAEQSHDSASFGTLLQHVVVERGHKDGAFPCQQTNFLDGGVGSARPVQQASSTGVKQIVLRLSGLRQSSATSGESPPVKHGEPVMDMGTDAESQHETHRAMWSSATHSIDNTQNDHTVNYTCNPDLQSSSQSTTVTPTVRVLHPGLQIPGDRGPKEEFAAQKDSKLGDDSGGCMGNVPSIDRSSCALDSSNGQTRNWCGQEPPGGSHSFPHPANPSWVMNANVCRSCPVPLSLNNLTANPCNAWAASRFTPPCTYQQGVPRAVHYISGDDVMVCPAPWVHEGRDESFRYLEMMPDPVYPPGHCNGFADDLDMDTQRHLEEQIGQEILLLSQKLANLQARYGARRPVHNSTKSAVLSCPLTPLLLDITRGAQRDVKTSNLSHAPSISQSCMSDGPVQQHPRPGTSSSSRITHRQPEPRCQVEERKLGAGRNGGINKAAASSTTAQSSSKRSDSGVQTTSFNANKTHPHSRAVSGPAGAHVAGNSTTGSRGSAAAQNGCPTEVTQTFSSKNSRTFSSPHRKRRDRQTKEHVEECSYSDDMKDLVKTTEGANPLQGYPNGTKRFDWVKTLRIGAGVRENQSCSDFASQRVQGKASSSSPHQELKGSGGEQDTRTPTSVSKSVQTGGTLLPFVDACVSKAPGILEDKHELKRRSADSSSIENRPGKKSGKRTLSPKEMEGLDSRINFHLLKAGLRRATPLWKTGQPVRNHALKVKKKTFGSRSPRRDGGKRLRTRTVFDLNLKVAKLAPRGSTPGVVPDVERQSEFTNCEAEYETFVEPNTNAGLHGSLDSEEDYTSHVKRDVPGLSADESQAKLSEAPVLSLMKTPQAPKKTFIRFIDLVVATKKKSQLSKINGRKASGVRYSYKRVDCSKGSMTGGCALDEGCQMKPQIHEGVVSQDTEVAGEQSVPKPSTESDPLSTLTAMDTQSTVQDQAANIMAFKGSSEPMSEECKDAHPSTDLDCSSSPSVTQASHLASMLSRVIPKQMESMDAAQLRARWEELIDALEKERLGLPKIKTSSRKMGVVTTQIHTSSPCETLRAPNQDQVGQAQKDAEDVALEDVSVTKGRPLWSNVEQKQEVVF